MNKPKNKAIFIGAGVLFLLMGGFLYLGRDPLSTEFQGTYRSVESNLTIVVFPQEANTYYCVAGGKSVLRGTYKKLSEGTYLLTDKEGEKEAIFHKTDFNFDDFTFRKVSDKPMMPPFFPGRTLE